MRVPRGTYYSILAGLLMFCFPRPSTGQVDFKKTLYVYRNNVAVLEMKADFMNQESLLNVPLPDSLVKSGVEVYSKQQSNLGSTRVVEIVQEERSIIKNKQEFLLANIGKQAELEVVEGNETINYEGEILPLEEDSRILLLRSESYLRMIPIEQVAHISILGDARLSTQKNTTSYKLVIQFDKKNKQNDLNIRVPIKGVSWEPLYTVWTDEKKMSLSAKLMNNTLNESEIAIVLVDDAYSEDNQKDLFSGSEIANWEKENLYKDEILQKPVFEEHLGLGKVCKARLNLEMLEMADTGMRTNKSMPLREVLPIYNNTSKAWPSGKVQIFDGSQVSFAMLNTILPNNGQSIEANENGMSLEFSRELVVTKYEEQIEQLEPKKRKEDPLAAKPETLELRMEFNVNNAFTKPGEYRIQVPLEIGKEMLIMKARMNGAPVAVINNEVELTGNIAAMSSGSFTLIVECLPQ